jgi:hypothetical protein
MKGGSMSEYNLAEYRGRRKKLAIWGMILTFIGVFHVIAPEIPFPIPFRGELGAYIALGIIITGAILYYFGKLKRPEDAMVIEVAKRANGYITAGILVDMLYLTTNVAENTIKRLWKNGYLGIMNKITNETPVAMFAMQFVGVGPKFDGVVCPRNQRQGQGGEGQTLDLEKLTANNPEMNVSDINRTLLHNTMRVGRSGQPVTSDEDAPRRRRGFFRRFGL